LFFFSPLSVFYTIFGLTFKNFFFLFLIECIRLFGEFDYVFYTIISVLFATVGDKGDTGDTGASIKGDKGDTGDTGASIKGDEGDTGDRGKDGLNSTLGAYFVNIGFGTFPIYGTMGDVSLFSLSLYIKGERDGFIIMPTIFYSYF
jgi:hypothetical protein